VAWRRERGRHWRHGEGEDEGYEFRIFFDLKQRLGVGQQGTGTMWACCVQHKKLAIKEIIKDIHMGRQNTQPAAGWPCPEVPGAPEGVGSEGAVEAAA